MATEKKKAVAYFRTSSASNVGEGKDSLPRQRAAVEKYALMEGLNIVEEFYDADVRGVVMVEDRREFKRMLDLCQKQHIGIILCETANRFSRDLKVQILGYDLVVGLGIQLIPVDAPAHFQDEDNPTAEMIRNLLGVVSHYEKRSLVKKLGDARQRKRDRGERSDGRIPPPPEAVELAKRLRAEGLSFKNIGIELSKAGFRVIQKDKEGTPQVTDRVLQAASVRNMLINL
jgi:DNA invertase Pin-like site-specific DNA recombinase